MYNFLVVFHIRTKVTKTIIYKKLFLLYLLKVF